MAASTGVAPICNAPPSPEKFPVTTPTIFNFTPPNIRSPESVIQAILQLQQALQALANPPPNAPLTSNQPSSSTGGGGGGLPGTGGGGVRFGGGGRAPTPLPDNMWQETGRNTQNVKVVNPDDDSQFVIVKEIVSITMTRPSTGETFTITRDAG
jgi:hypothetical protein